MVQGPGAYFKWPKPQYGPGAEKGGTVDMKRKVVVLGVLLLSLVSCSPTVVKETVLVEKIVRETVIVREIGKETAIVGPAAVATRLPEPTSSPPERNRILVYGGASDSKLEGLAFSKGIRLTLAGSETAFMDELKQPDVAAAAYGRREPSAEVLVALDSFAESGGWVVFLYGDAWADRNDLLQELFGVSIAREEVKRGEDVLVYQESMLPHYMDGLAIGVARDNRQLQLSAYLLVREGDVGAKRYAMSDAAGKQRLLCYSNSNERVSFWPVVKYCFADGCAHVVFWKDQFFDQFDNEAGALAMLNFLLGKSGPSSSSSSVGDRPATVGATHIERVEAIAHQVASGSISQGDTERQLEAIATEVGKAGFAWLVRNVPMYNTETKEWHSFDSYSKDLARQSGVSRDSRLARDPVGVGVDLMFGNPSVEQIQEWLGFR